MHPICAACLLRGVCGNLPDLGLKAILGVLLQPSQMQPWVGVTLGARVEKRKRDGLLAIARNRFGHRLFTILLGCQKIGCAIFQLTI